MAQAKKKEAPAAAKESGKEKEKEKPITYTVYTHDWPKEGQTSGAWEQKQSTTDMDKALREAESLHGSGKYQKVEVKKKYVEEKTGRAIDITLRTFEGKAKMKIGAGLIAVFAVLCGFAAFGITYVVAQNVQPQATAEQTAEAH